MRKPTEPYEDYEWWRSALSGGNPPLHENDPQPGWFKRRKFRGGPWSPSVIWRVSRVDDETGELVEDESLLALEDGVSVDPFEIWTWVCVTPITPEEYHSLLNNESEEPQTLTESKPAFPGG